MRSRFRVGLAWVTCSCRRRNAGNVRKLTCQNLYPHVAVLALVLAGHGTLRMTAGTAACSCKYCHEFRIKALKTKTGRSLRVHGEYRLGSMRSGKRRCSHVRSGTCIARTAASECADPYGDVQLAGRCEYRRSYSRVAPVPVRTATHHPREMVPSKAAAMRSAAPLAAARGRPQACAQAPRRCRVVCAAGRSAAVVRRLRACAFRSQCGPDESARCVWEPLCTARAHALTGVGVRCGAAAAVIGHRRRLDHSAQCGARARGAQCAMRSAQVRTVAAAALGSTHAHMHARAST
jgi:hypothetical protein